MHVWKKRKKKVANKANNLKRKQTKANITTLYTFFGYLDIYKYQFDGSYFEVYEVCDKMGTLFAIYFMTKNKYYNYIVI